MSAWQPAGYCILVAEDSGIVRCAVVMELTQQGCSVPEAADSAAALRLQEAHDGTIRQDLITGIARSSEKIDGHMPARESRRKWPDLKVLIVLWQSESDTPAGTRVHDRPLVEPDPPDFVAVALELLLRMDPMPSGPLH